MNSDELIQELVTARAKIAELEMELAEKEAYQRQILERLAAIQEWITHQAPIPQVPSINPGYNPGTFYPSTVFTTDLPKTYGVSTSAGTISNGTIHFTGADFKVDPANPSTLVNSKPLTFHIQTDVELDVQDKFETIERLIANKKEHSHE